MHILLPFRGFLCELSTASQYRKNNPVCNEFLNFTVI